jgi:type IV pilus assembly protein PilY1
LADIAFKYWSTDLVNLTNNLTPYVIDRSGDATAQYWNPRNNPATWQHMVNFTISFGLGATLVDPAWGGSTFAGDYAQLATGAKTWPPVDESAAGSDSPEDHVYDLWHAAINSRGEFFNADDPAGIASAFQSVFNSIITKNPSSAALAANSTTIQSGTMVYQARYDSSDWHGQLLAYSVNLNGDVGSVLWDASQKVPPSASRKILTWNGSAGTQFNSCTTNLSSSQKAALDRNASGVNDGACSQRLAWLRGDASNELRNGGAFRDRSISVLGDIVNSGPAYVKDQDHGYGSTQSGLTEKSSYATFVASKATRLPMVYVGANDGMLHGFRADAGSVDSGKELFAYVPAGVYSKLSALTDSAYPHTFYVDGSPAVGDAYWSGAWRTVLVSGLGAGGRSVFALDVTSPTAFDASHV